MWTRLRALHTFEDLKMMMKMFDPLIEKSSFNFKFVMVQRFETKKGRIIGRSQRKQLFGNEVATVFPSELQKAINKVSQ